MLNTRSFHLGRGILPRIMTSITNSCYRKDSMPPPRSCWFTTRLMQAHYNYLHCTWQEFRQKKNIFYLNRLRHWEIANSSIWLQNDHSTSLLHLLPFSRYLSNPNIHENCALL